MVSQRRGLSLVGYFTVVYHTLGSGELVWNEWLSLTRVVSQKGQGTTLQLLKCNMLCKWSKHDALPPFSP